jgi:predicted dehydrogenase
MSTFTRRNDWQTLAKNGGGLLNNHVIHFLDQILQLLPGNVTQVMGDLQQIASAGDVEDHTKTLSRPTPARRRILRSARRRTSACRSRTGSSAARTAR